MKELLLKDLCARVPYGLQVNLEGDNEPYVLLSVHPNKDIALIGINMGGVYATSKVKIDTVKPYLRPMPSMTEEELYEVQEILGKGIEVHIDFISIVDSSIKALSYLELQALFDWLNKKMFDYLGLIPRGLALKAPKDMYSYEV